MVTSWGSRKGGRWLGHALLLASPSFQTLSTTARGAGRAGEGVTLSRELMPSPLPAEARSAGTASKAAVAGAFVVPKAGSRGSPE